MKFKKKKPRKKHRFCGAFLLAPLFGLEPKTPVIRRCAPSFACPSYNGHLLKQSAKACSQSNFQLPTYYLMRMFGSNTKKRSKTKTESFWTPSSFCGSPASRLYELDFFDYHNICIEKSQQI